MILVVSTLLFLMCRLEVSLHPVGLATCQLVQGFPWFSLVIQQMLSWYPYVTSLHMQPSQWQYQNVALLLTSKCWIKLYYNAILHDCRCGLVVRIPSYGSRGPGSISGAARISEK
jgi:hypothetical protein